MHHDHTLPCMPQERRKTSAGEISQENVHGFVQGTVQFRDVLVMTPLGIFRQH